MENDDTEDAREISARQVRSAEITPIARPLQRNDEGGELEAQGPRRYALSFSSEVAVERMDWFGDTYEEVLGHDEGEVRVQHFASGRAPFLADHRQSIDNQIGRVVEARIEGARLEGTIELDATERAQEIGDRIDRGELRQISVGYQIHRVRTEQREGRPDEMRAIDWEPLEASLVAIPADRTVGIGRSDEPGERLRVVVERGQTMENDEVDNGQTPANAANPAETQRSEDEIRRAEADRVGEIYAVGARHNVDRAMIDQAVRDNVSVAEFKGRVLDERGADDFNRTQTSAVSIGMSRGDVERFSVMRLVRHMHNRGDNAAREAASFELEACAAAEAHWAGARSGGFVVPEDVLSARSAEIMRQRALEVGTPAQGGNLVATDLDGSLVDVLRADAVIVQSGAQVIRGLEGDLDLPRKTSSVTPESIAEGASANFSQPGFDLVQLRPHQLAAPVEVTRRMRQQSSLDVDSLLISDITETMALDIDRQGLVGSGVGEEVLGIVNTAGIGKTTFAAATPTWGEVTGMYGALGNANARRGSLGWVGTPLNAAALMAAPRFAGGDTPILNDDGMLIRSPYRDTTNMNEGDHLYGNWGDVIVAFWGGGMELLVDPLHNIRSGSTALAGHATWDLKIRRLPSMVLGNDTP